MRTREYYSIDFSKLIFAILIICLHVPQGETGAMHFVSAYISRLGVPFFFVVAGFFGHKKILKVGGMKYYSERFKRLGKVFITWMIIYLPLTFYSKCVEWGG